VGRQRAKQRFLELLNATGHVTTHDLEHDIVLAGEAAGDLRAAAYELETAGRVIVLRETMAPRGLDFTGLLLPR
jgi:adenine deaminase